MQVAASIVGFVLFVGLIIIHEWGHFMIARRNGVKVEEFGIGFPPRAWKKRLKSGMILSLNWLPLGGFVRLKGENEASKSPGSFGAASLNTKVKIMLAGVSMNFVAGLLLLTFLAIVGMPKAVDNQFTVPSDTKTVRREIRAGYVDSSSPAAQAGLKFKDRIVSLTGNRCDASGRCVPEKVVVDSPETLHDATRAFAGQSVNLVYTRGSEVFDKTVALRDKAEVDASLKTDNPKGYLGIVSTDLQVRRSTWSAPVVAFGFTGQLIKLTFEGIGHALGGLGSTIAGLVTGNHAARENGQTQATEQTGGIIAIVAVLWASGSLGWLFMLMIVAILSLTLAIINILPIPALDGGRLTVTLFFRAIRKPLSKATENRIHGTGMVILLTLFALITIVDVKRFF